jgi:hypothetical protein
MSYIRVGRKKEVSGTAALGAFLKWAKRNYRKHSYWERHFVEDALSDKKFPQKVKSWAELKNYLESVPGVVDNALTAAESLINKWPDSQVDGLGPRDVKRILTSLRKVWGWNYARRLVIERCTDAKGFGRCESCRKRVPKIFVDHKRAIGTFRPRTIIERMFLSSEKLQGLCNKCHRVKTKRDMKLIDAEKGFL